MGDEVTAGVPIGLVILKRKGYCAKCAKKNTGYVSGEKILASEDINIKCHAITEKGTRCKLGAKNYYCGIHKAYMPIPDGKCYSTNEFGERMVITVKDTTILL